MIGDPIGTPAEWALEDLAEQIKSFQDSLSAEMEIGIDAGGGGNTIHVESVRAAGSIIVFMGVDDQGREARLLQHHTQVNVQVVAVKKLGEDARRIGF